MTELLGAALELTVLGMGMTFLSIGALTLGMYVLTAVFRGKESAVVLESDQDEPVEEDIVAYREGEIAGDGEGAIEARRRAVAAAVAVSLALEEMQQDASVHPASPAPLAVENAWSAFARSLQLSRRAQYDARRFRS